MESQDNLDELETTTTPLETSKSCILSLKVVVPARLVLYLMSLSGFIVSFMLRTDINIAIVAMVRLPPPSTPGNTTVDSQNTCYSPSPNSSAALDHAPPEEEGEFAWDLTEQGAVLGAFYWMYFLSQVPGGVLTQRFGTKVVFGCAQLGTALCTLLIPRAASLHYGAVVILRAVQGLASGFTWPAMYAVVGQWIPHAERSRFMSSFQGTTIGIGLTYPLGGFLIANHGWRALFYTTGSLGVLWCVFWYFLVFDSPQKHPRISRQELEYIKTNIKTYERAGKSSRVPWRSIATSLPVWAVAITTFGRIWIQFTFIILGPMYMKTVLGFGIQKNGVVSGLPYLLTYLSSAVFCSVADYLFIHNLVGATTVRKVFTIISQVVTGWLVVTLGYLGCRTALVLVTWFSAVVLFPACFAGAMASAVDISPTFAGPVIGFAQTIQMSASFIAPLVASFILKNGTGLEQWRKVFLVACTVSVVTCVFFQVFGSARVQHWNYPDGKLPDGDLPNGELPDGELPDGGLPDGDFMLEMQPLRKDKARRKGRPAAAMST